MPVKSISLDSLSLSELNFIMGEFGVMIHEDKIFTAKGEKVLDRYTGKHVEWGKVMILPGRDMEPVFINADFFSMASYEIEFDVEIGDE